MVKKMAGGLCDLIYLLFCFVLDIWRHCVGTYSRNSVSIGVWRLHYTADVWAASKVRHLRRYLGLYHLSEGYFISIITQYINLPDSALIPLCTRLKSSNPYEPAS